MSKVIYKNLNSSPILAVGGSGVWLEDATGKRYLDTCGGVAVSSLGHGHPRIAAAFEREAKKLAWAHAGSFTTAAAEELAERLVAASGGLARAQFLSGGSEVMELAMKIAYQYQCERGLPDKSVFISRQQSYHGSTLGTLSISGNPQRQSVFGRLFAPAEFVSPCYAYRDQRPDESQEQYATRLADELDAKIRSLGSENVAAFFAETVVGSTNGAVPAVPGYFRKIKAVCERHDVLLVLDEVMAGMGRTGQLFAYTDDGIVPDMVAVGKGLAAGYMPISALLISDRVHSVMARGSGVLGNGQTHVNHPLACAIALEVQQVIVEEDLLTQVRQRGEQLRTWLRESLADLDIVGDVRGRGLFVGVEFVESRSTKAPFRGGGAYAAALKQEALQRGLLIYPGSGTVQGTQGNHVLFAPPFITSEGELGQMVERFNAVVRAVAY
ncbi:MULTISPECIES: aspartate aminotransferase family protein [Pseudomonas]|jgi:adenosylmethionine-8-amino-7-oxononanoate aminotransferase|uniref:Aspartate aminotransferase family protein n=1 Tax=Pseudomonas synxantha TaxID=47883 RepID=A0A5D3G228_9PSED|nr:MULTISPECIES: aspartate aminotransferase family protein [Pseudomonas]MBY8971294.1 aspartate aminotransferase family protein [Pseudomonas sp. P867]MCK3831836.1 aspartate aminotransferase family protein [Pseudomonas fluorescens]MCK3837405.1 aspartate aminotransferase family protein [Pseudomonas sp. NCIMB 10586]MCK3861809.1 aspartate aminotransferase family protein [Pseudomonas sp. B329]OPA99894.1 Putative aminotransferase [Pseudomonas synxantha]